MIPEETLAAAVCDATAVDERIYFNDDKVEHGRAVVTNLAESGYSVVPTADLDRLRAAAEARDRAIADIDYRLAHLHAGGGYTVPRRKAAEAWARAHLNGVRAALGDRAAEEGR